MAWIDTQIRDLGSLVLGRRPFEFPPTATWVSQEPLSRPRLTRVPQHFVLQRRSGFLARSFRLTDENRTIGTVREPLSLRRIFGARVLKGMYGAGVLVWRDEAGSVLATARRAPYRGGARTLIRDRRADVLGVIEERRSTNVVGSYIELTVRHPSGDIVARSKKLMGEVNKIELVFEDTQIMHVARDPNAGAGRWHVYVERPDSLHPSVAVFLAALASEIWN